MFLCAGRQGLNFPLLALRQIGGPESRGPTRSIRHWSEIRFGQDSRVEQKEQRRKPEFESTKRCDKRCAVREVNHIVDIMKTIFYIARIRAGLGWAERMSRPSALRQGHRGTSQHVFWLPGVHSPREPGRQFLARRSRRSESPWILSKACLENWDQCVFIAELMPVRDSGR